MLAQSLKNVKTQKTAVRYDRHEQVWLAINGSVQSFPAGPDGKRQAMLAALEHDQPQLYAVVRDISQIHYNAPSVVDRLIKAAQLLTHGHVYADDLVKSQTGDEIYHTTFDHCSCEDFEHGQLRHAGVRQYGGAYVDGVPTPVCKHILARHLAYFTGWPLTDAPIPFAGE